MPVYVDRWGGPVTADSDGAVAALDHLLDGYLRFRPDLPQRLAQAVDGGAPLARFVQGCFLLLANRAEPAKLAAQIHAGLDADRAALTRREQFHIDALGAWCDGDLERVADVWETALAETPTDLIACRFGHFLFFSQGRFDRMHVPLTAARDAWGGRPDGGYLDGMAGFLLEEADGAYDEALALAIPAAEADPADLFSVHTVAHVYEMQGRHTDGIAWLTDRPDLVGAGTFANHLWWHRALYNVELERWPEALALFDEWVYPARSEETLDLTNAVSLLLRLELAGVDVGNRWQTLAPQCAVRIGHHTHVFNDIHCVAALAHERRDDDVDTMLRGMAAWMAERNDHAAQVLRSGAMELANAVACYHRGELGRAAELFASSRPQWWRIGGSRAQRDVFEQLYIDALVRTRQLDTATALLEARVAAKPANPLAWHWLAAVAAAAGDANRADAARASAEHQLAGAR